MKISIVINLPSGRAAFVGMMLLQIIGASIGFGTCPYARCVLNGTLTIVLALTAAVGCFWQQPDLAYLSHDHAHRAVSVLVLMMLVIASNAYLDWLALCVVIADGLYVLSSAALALTHQMRNEHENASSTDNVVLQQ